MKKPIPRHNKTKCSKADKEKIIQSAQRNDILH